MHALFATAPVATALLLGVSAQNVTLLSRLDNRVAYAAVWGYTSPDFREYAIVGERTGTMIVDCTDPVNPVEVGYFTSPSSSWREMTSFGPIVYSCSEHHGGIRLIDMTNPAAPADLGLRLSTAWPNTHSISVDTEQRRVICNGTSGGMRILNVATDPRNPTLMATYTSAYVHDSMWRRGKGYLAQINSGNLRIVNSTNPSSLTILSTTTTPGAFTHNAWVTDDDQLMFTTDENSTGYLQTYNIANPAAPVRLGSYIVPGAIVHNVFGIGRTIYVAHYTDGFHMLDAANPSSIAQVARYDTSTSASGYNGAWGCYPWTDSGVIYVSDIQNGLYVLRADVGHINRYGTAVAGANGVPRLQTEGGAVEVGQAALRLQLANLNANAPFVVVVGAAQGTGSILGIPLHVNLAGAILVNGVADAQGKFSLPFGIPNQPGLANQRIYLQIVSINGSSLISSRGMWAGIGART